jgi:hypothetical protein
MRPKTSDNQPTAAQHLPSSYQQNRESPPAALSAGPATPVRRPPFMFGLIFLWSTLGAAGALVLVVFH